MVLSSVQETAGKMCNQLQRVEMNKVTIFEHLALSAKTASNPPTLASKKKQPSTSGEFISLDHREGLAPLERHLREALQGVASMKQRWEQFYNMKGEISLLREQVCKNDHP